jgi:hypothetical protein
MMEKTQNITKFPGQFILSNECEKNHSGTPPFMKEIIAREWPELMEWPVNRPFGTTKIVIEARSVLRKIGLQMAS